MKEYTVEICGKHVTLRYCAATEYGFERMTGKSVAIFLPTFGTDGKGNEIVTAMPEAAAEDYISLAMSAVLAHYARANEDAPITIDDLLYDATPGEITNLITTVSKARNEWYRLPDVVKEKVEAEKASEDIKKADTQPKNA